MKRHFLLGICFLGCCFLVQKSEAQNTDSVNFVQANWQKRNIADGLIWEHCHFDSVQIFAAKENVHLLRFDLRSKALQLQLGSAGDSLLKTSTLASKANAIAAINGSFFDVKKGGAVDFIRINGKIYDTSRVSKGALPEHQRAALVFDSSGNAQIVFTQDSFDLSWANRLPFANVLVSGPLLLKNSETIPLLDRAFNSNRHPRTCACITTQQTLLVWTVDGRTAQSYGISLSEATQMARWWGCKDAINFDGGGSTTMYIRGELFDGVVNMPCDNRQFDHEGERVVSNILMLIGKTN